MAGITTNQALKLQQQYGRNILPEAKSLGLMTIFLRQFNSPFVYMLFAATLVSLALGQHLNALFIGIVLLLNAIIGCMQEYSAQKAAIALQKMVPQFAIVIRDGIKQKLNATELVPGDWVQLTSGDRVPADIQLQETQQLLINESILTGESQAAAKQAKSITSIASDAPLSDQTDRAFAGTLVTHGRAQGEIIATGSRSAIGRIATEVNLSEAVKPPLLQRIERFTLRISYSVLIVIALLFTITVLRGDELATVFLLGVALAVSAIPEGLPAAITIALAIGMRRMAHANVIVRKLVAVESLGSCTYIASDKTGTLTVNELTIKKIILPNGDTFNVDGEGINVHGEISLSDNTQCVDDSKSNHFPELNNLILAGLCANEASLTLPKKTSEKKVSTKETKTEQWISQGDGVDIAFLVLAAKYGIDQAQAKIKYPEIYRIPYESENAFSASINQIGTTKKLFVKGSTEKILSMCIHNQEEKTLLNKQMETLASQGYRVLALASKDVTDIPNSNLSEPNVTIEQLTFLGLVAMIDPLRPEAKDAIEQCKKAQIEVAMITGDHPQTALAIARDLGIANLNTKTVTGADLKQALQQGEQALTKLITSTHVFARVEPNQKLQIVQQLIKQGHFVAVTGDGVNDAPALRHAHVGIAMGKRGTDVARESAELIITNDHFSAIVQSIKQGRIAYNNIRKVVFLLISTGAAEITLFILSVLFGYPMPLFPLQLLWLNLVTNGIQDVALAFEPEEGNELSQPPRSPKETIFNRLMLERVAINAVVMGGIAFMVFITAMDQGMSESEARNLTLLLMVLFENVHVLNSRSETQSIFKQPFFSNPLLLFGMLAAQGIHITAMYTPGLNSLLNISPVSFTQWSTLLAIALVLIIVDETHKALLKRRREC